MLNIGCILYPYGELILEYPGTGQEPLDIICPSSTTTLCEAIFSISDSNSLSSFSN